MHNVFTVRLNDMEKNGSDIGMEKRERLRYNRGKGREMLPTEAICGLEKRKKPNVSTDHCG